MLNYNISFYLRTSRKQEDGKIPIYTRIRLENERLEISINQSIEQKFWNNNRQQVIKSPDAALINSVINEFHTDLLQVITNLQLSKADVTIENVRKLLKGEQVVQNYCLIKVLEEHNRNFEKLVGVQYSYGSYKNYKTTLAFLKEFINNRYKRH